MSQRLQGKVAVITGAASGIGLVVDGGITIGPHHAWDPSVAPPMAEALGLTPEQVQAMFPAPAGDACEKT